MSSIVTIIGSNFISTSQSCFAKIGSSPCSGVPLSSCNIASDSLVVITIDNTNAALGAAGICLNISNPPYVSYASSGYLISIVASPSIVSARPFQGYVSSTITVSGSNFLVGNYTCVMTVGTLLSSICSIVSSQSVVFVIPFGSSFGSKILYLKFNNGGAGSTAVAPGAILNIAASPSITSFSPIPSYRTSRVTVTVSRSMCFVEIV